MSSYRITLRATRASLTSRTTPSSLSRPCTVARRSPLLFVTRGIRGIQNFDGSFELTEEAQTSLYEMLRSDTFAKQVVKECKLEHDTNWEFTEMLFQPVPWSPATKKGMPQEYETYLEDPNYVVINVPPTVMFKAKIFDPSRLCAIFKRASQ